MLALLMSATIVIAGEHVVGDGESFAQEYEQLGFLLEKIQDEKTAILYKSSIVKELYGIKRSVAGQRDYASLSKEEKQGFIRKFQNNRFHCGYVTKVMDERNRLLLNREIREELGEILDQLLQ